MAILVCGTFLLIRLWASFVSGASVEISSPEKHIDHRQDHGHATVVGLDRQTGPLAGLSCCRIGWLVLHQSGAFFLFERFSVIAVHCGHRVTGADHPSGRFSLTSVEAGPGYCR